MRNILTKWLLLSFAVLAVGCNKMLENQDDTAIKENETLIEQYIQSNKLAAIRDTSGLHYVVHVANPSGRRPSRGESVAISFKMFTLQGGFIDSASVKEPFTFPFGAGVMLPGLERGISQLRQGEKATILLPFYLAFGNVAYERVPAYSAIRVELEVLSIKNEAEQIGSFTRTLVDPVSYVTPRGVRVVRLNAVSGDSLGAGKLVGVFYTGKLLDGQQFDKGGFDYTTGTGGLIAGFDEGIRSLRSGEKALLIFPSSLGYGAAGIRNQQTGGFSIPPYAPLIFEVEVSRK